MHLPVSANGLITRFGNLISPHYICLGHIQGFVFVSRHIRKTSMQNKIRQRIDSWDLKSFMLTIVLVTVGVLTVYFFIDIRDRFRKSDEENFTGRAIGEIFLVEPIERITQTKWKGTQIFIDSYRIMYSFKVNGQTFKGMDMITVSLTNKKLLNKILQRQQSDRFTVKFNVIDPKKSILVND